MIEYKFNEPELLQELQEYIDATYTQHYVRGDNRQTFESIVDCGHGEGFTMGNIKKYSDRYGVKNGHNRQDIMKVLHYAILALYVHDLNNNNRHHQPIISIPLGDTGYPPPPSGIKD